MKRIIVALSIILAALLLLPYFGIDFISQFSANESRQPAIQPSRRQERKSVPSVASTEGSSNLEEIENLMK